jgi:cation diffusion facilitator family transporter
MHDELKRRVAALSIASNTVLIVGKLAVGALIGSVSVISEAVHSGVDLVASVIAWIAVRFASTPADERHPYGYGKLENLSGVAEAMLIFLGAGWIMFESVHKLMAPEPVETPAWGVGVMAVSSVINLMVSRVLFAVGRKTDSVALQADAWHLRTDVYTSAGVMAGLMVIALGRRFMPAVSLDWVDPVSAMLVAILIVKAAWTLTAEAGADLLDARIGAEDESVIHGIVTANEAVRGCHALRSRKAGSTRFIDFHLVVDGHMTVQTSHDVAMGVTREIEERLPGARVVTHVEPCLGRCTPRCRSGCLLTPARREEIQRENGVDPAAFR